MATTMSGLVVLDPTSAPVTEGATRAPRPKSLEGKRVGFIDNSKRNSDKVLHYLDELLRERYGIANSLHVQKPTASRVAPPDMVEQIRRECDVVIPGVGD